MKRILLIVLGVIFLAAPAFAWTFKWDASAGVDGYKVFWKDLSATTFTEIDVGDVTSLDLEPLNLIEGTRYEFYITAYSMGSTSGESDHLRWTQPLTPIVIEMPNAPSRLVLEF